MWRLGTPSKLLSITYVGSRASDPRNLGIFRAKLRITHKERNQWGCDGYRCVEYALVSEAFLREANGAVMCGTGASSVEQA